MAWRAGATVVFYAGEMLGPILLSLHNLTYYQQLLAGARSAIEADQFERLLPIARGDDLVVLCEQCA